MKELWYKLPINNYQHILEEIIEIIKSYNNILDDDKILKFKIFSTKKYKYLFLNVKNLDNLLNYLDIVYGDFINNIILDNPKEIFINGYEFNIYE